MIQEKIIKFVEDSVELNDNKNKENIHKEMVPKFHTQHIDYTCNKCNKKSPKGLRLDLDSKDKRWLCDKCYFNNN